MNCNEKIKHNPIFTLENIVYKYRVCSDKRFVSFIQNNNVKSIIYAWINTNTGLMYVGSTNCPLKRFMCFCNFNNSYGGGIYLEKARKKSVLNDWKYEILEIVDTNISDIIDRENYFIKLYNTIKNGYNVSYARKNVNVYCTWKNSIVYENAKYFFKKYIVSDNAQKLKFVDILDFFEKYYSEGLECNFTYNMYANGKKDGISKNNLVFLPSKLNRYLYTMQLNCKIDKTFNYPSTFIYRRKDGKYRFTYSNTYTDLTTAFKDGLINLFINFKSKIGTDDTPENKDILNTLRNYTLYDFLKFKYQNANELIKCIKDNNIEDILFFK